MEPIEVRQWTDLAMRQRMKSQSMFTSGVPPRLHLINPDGDRAAGKSWVAAGASGNSKEVVAGPRNQHYRASRDGVRPKILFELSA